MFSQWGSALQRLLLRLAFVAGLMSCALAAPAAAQTCGAATSAGTAPVGWESYCWLDFTTYNDATARSGAGQNMSFTLTDGSVFAMNVRTVSTAATGVNAVVAPSWSGGAVGNTAFLGIPGRPILYGANNASTVTLTFSNMTITPPTGGASGSYMFIVGDGESSNNGETLRYNTTGGTWTLLDQVDPISGSIYPTYTITGQQADVIGVAGTVGAQIFGSTMTSAPQTVTTRIVNGGLQGVMFAVRFASIRLNKTIVSGRVAASDQFSYAIRATASGTTLASRTTNGTANTGFAPTVASLASGVGITLTEAMAAGSASTLAAYSARLTCTNSNTGSTTPLPSNVASTNYSFGNLQYGDNVSCMFTNTPFARLALAKSLGGTRAFAADQFTVRILQGATVTASATTTGTGATVATGSTGATTVTAATTYAFDEIAAGTTNLSYYTATLACSNSFTGSATVLPTTVGGSVTPVLGDNISCTLTNTPKPAKAELSMTKVSIVLNDPINGMTNPKLIPGAVVRYTITVKNIGNGPVDASTTATPTITLTDPITATLGSYVQGTAVVFTDGSPASTLACTYATCVSWTKTAGGTTGFGAALTPDGAGFDDAITGIRIRPTGTFAAATAAGQPFFTIQFDARIK